MNGKAIASWLTTGIVTASVFVAGVFVGGSGVFAQQLSDYGLRAFAAGALSNEQPEGVDFTPVWRAWHVLEERFVDTQATTTDAQATSSSVHSDEMVWGMIQGLAASLEDPYTVFLPPSEAEIFQDDISGSFEGVGMEIAIRDGVLTVVSPLKNTPAYRAGIKSADKVVAIDGESTKSMGIDAAVQRIRGPRGSEVVLTIVRESEAEPRDISVIRDVINIPTLETTRRGDGIFVIELFNFSAPSPELFKDAMEEFAASGYSKLIIDVRGNPGGYLEAAVDMASWFLPSGRVVVAEDFGGNEPTRTHRSRGYELFDAGDVTLVILIDKGSASASEILAGSLREHGVATLIGTPSFGKGSVQELVDITSDTALKVSVARWLLAGTTFITHDGIEPDVLVEFPEDAPEGDDTDYILEAGVEYLLGR